MKRPTALLPPGERRVAAEVFIGTAFVLVLFAKLQGVAGLGLAGVGLLLAAGLLLVVQSPVGSIPLGYALLIALAELLAVSRFFPVLGLGLLATVPVLASRYGQGDAGRRVMRWAIAGVACGVAAAGMRQLVPGPSAGRTLLHVTVAGTVFLAMDLLTRRLWPSPTAPRMRLSEAWPVNLSLLCAAGLIAVGYKQEPWMALVALFPLLLTRFAFDRYAAAQQAYRQTIKALSIVPEVAGVTPLGHGERSAVYAVALARRLGMTSEAVDRIATAARLHHIGYVTLDDPQQLSHVTDKYLLSRLGGDILRQTQFLSEVGDLVESVHSADPQFKTREAAVLRVAAEFDNLVLEDPSRAPGAVELLAASETDAFDAAAVLALRWVLEEDPELVERAISSGAPLTEAAASSEVARG